MPKNAKESVDLPDFAKESVAQIQILCTFQARAAKGRRSQRARSKRSARLARNPCARTRA
ncbi:hypothetical protein HMPREF1492_1213 [Atopobium sp. BS2]|nr:hypothetical protein HMPREF1492_1213 [Atopobium sp. BS2]